MSKGSVRRTEGQRLAYYEANADAAFWDHRWQGILSQNYYKNWLQGRLGYLEKPVTKYLSQDKRTIEAGCGMGQWVLGLRARGYDAQGVDFALETIDRVKELFPDLPIGVGDVTNLDVPDGYYNGYISLGVVEHRQEGPEPFLEEAHRVLTDGGIALISVPYFHSLRKLKSRLGAYSKKNDDLFFYQYAFTRSEFGDILNKHGFEVVEWFHYDPIKGLMDELPLFRHLTQIPYVGSLVIRGVGRLPYVRRCFGHMMMAAAQKIGS